MTFPVLIEQIESQLPEIVDPVVSFDVVSGKSSIYWSKPRLRSLDRFDPSVFVATGLSQFNAAKVNDGELSDVAFAWLAGAGASNITADFGAGNGVAIRECVYAFVDPPPVTIIHPTFYYSDDGVNFTPISHQLYEHPNSPAGIKIFIARWADLGVRRAWRGARLASSFASQFTEFWLRTYGAEVDVDSLVVYNGDAVYDTLPGTYLPTASKPYDLLPVTDWQRPAAGANPRKMTIDVRIATVTSRVGVEHESLGFEIKTGATGSRSSTLTLAGGLNANVALPSLEAPLHLEVSGPGAPFTIQSFDTGIIGNRVFVRNPLSHSMTIDHNAAVAGFPTVTRTGAPILIAGPGYAEFVLTADNKYLLLYGGDAAGLK